MLKNILWGIVAVAVIVLTVYIEYKKRQKYKKPNRRLSKEEEKQIAIE